ncbi:MAG: hypothetical protein AAGN35_09280 [Bacteroidota bacterium]
MEKLRYDLNGNITQARRNGLLTSNSFGLIDNLIARFCGDSRTDTISLTMVSGKRSRLLPKFFTTVGVRPWMVFLVLFFPGHSELPSQVTAQEFDFYGDKIVVSGDFSWTEQWKHLEIIDAQSGMYHIDRMPSIKIQRIVNSFAPVMKSAGWNDYMVFKFLQKVLDRSLPDFPPTFKIMFEHKALQGLGVSSLVAFSEGELFLFVEGNEVFDVPTFRDETGKRYYLIDQSGTVEDMELEFISKTKFPTHRFNLSLRKLPQLSEHLWDTLSFEFRQSEHVKKLQVPLSRHRVAILSQHPELRNETYFDIPIAQPTISAIAHGLWDKELHRSRMDSLLTLIEFVKFGIENRDDSIASGKAHESLTPEETLFRTYGDCEDKAALLWQLQKELIGYPMITLEFDNHICLAIACPPRDEYVKPIVIAGKSYFFVDPTLGDHLPLIGSWPFNLFFAPFEVGLRWTR